jgi:hypothetical protein
MIEGQVAEIGGESGTSCPPRRKGSSAHHDDHIGIAPLFTISQRRFGYYTRECELTATQVASRRPQLGLSTAA